MLNLLYQWLKLQVARGRTEFRTIDAITGVSVLAGRKLTKVERGLISRGLEGTIEAGLIMRAGDRVQLFRFISGDYEPTRSVPVSDEDAIQTIEDRSPEQVLSLQFQWARGKPVEATFRLAAARVLREICIVDTLPHTYPSVEVRRRIAQSLGEPETAASWRPTTKNGLVLMMSSVYEDFTAFEWCASPTGCDQTTLTPRFAAEYDLYDQKNQLESWLRHMSSSASAWRKLPPRQRERMVREVWVRSRRFYPGDEKTNEAQA